MPGLRKDGQRISIAFTIVPLEDEQGRMTGMAAILRDVTKRFAEMKALRQELAEAIGSAGRERNGWRRLAAMANPFFTVGHSRHPIPEFVGLLRPAEVGLVVDVRTVPRSRTNPQFNRDVLPTSLAAYQIGYDHVAELGGLRGRQRLVEPSPNGFWENDSFRNYADYALTDGFRIGLARLRELGAERRTVIMCAEAVWWRCHRRIITDYLLDAGQAVFHILAPHTIQEAKMTPAARQLSGRGLVYPPEASADEGETPLE